MIKSNFNSEILTKRGRYIKSAELMLQPTEDTLKTIQNLKLNEKDKAWNNKAKACFPLIDKYMTARIDDLLQQLSESEQFRGLNIDARIKDVPDDKKKSVIEIIQGEIEKIATQFIKKELKEKFDASWLFDKETKNKKAENSLPKFLESIGDNAGAQQMRDMDGTLALFTTFCTSRMVLITQKVPERVASNFARYCDNIPLFKRIKENNDEFYAEYAEELDVASTYDGYLMFLRSDSINAYNAIISGKSISEGVEVLGYNGYANEKNNRIRTNNLDEKVYFSAKKLHKQILFPKEKMFEVDYIENNDELISVLQSDMDVMPGLCEKAENMIRTLPVDTVIGYNRLHQLSHILYGDHDKIDTMLAEKDLKEKAYTINELAEICETTPKEIIRVLLISVSDRKNEVDNTLNTLNDLDILHSDNIKHRQRQVDAIIAFVNSVKEIDRLVSLFRTNDEKATVTNVEFMDLHEALRQNSNAENLMRNYITKSLNQEATKIRSLFDKPRFLSASWWKGNTGDKESDQNKFSKDTNAIVKMDGKFYLLTLTSDCKPVVLEEAQDANTLIYVTKKAQKAYNVLSRIAFSNPAVVEFFDGNKGSTYVLKTKMREPIVITKEQYDLYKSGAVKKEFLKTNPDKVDEFKKNLVKIITLYKKILDNYTEFSKFDFSDMRPASAYEDTNEFFNEVDTRTIRMEWKSYSRAQIEGLVKDGKALLFLITNRNMYKEGKKKTTPAEVFLSIFSDENMAHTEVMLNANPAVYFRPALIKPRETHPVGSELVNKRDVDGNYVPTDIYEQLYHYHNGRLSKEELTDEALKWLDRVSHHKASTAINRNNRYMKDQYSMVYSYTIGKDIEKESLTVLNDDIDRLSNGNVLSIVRGVTDLLYYTLTDENGKLISFGSMNKIGDIDYAAKLRALDITRKTNKSEHWVYDTKVADIKDSFVQDAAAYAVKLAYENNACIAVELVDKPEREKWACIDYQVFGKFIDALVQKAANYHVRGIVKKDPGSVLNPLQLSYDTDGWHKGLIYTIPSGYIRTVDSKSGFICGMNLAELNSMKKQKAFFKKFKRIEKVGNRIEFEFNLSDLEEFGIKGQAKDHWTLQVSGMRTMYSTEKKSHVEYPDIVKYLYEQIDEFGDSATDDLLASLDKFGKKSTLLLLNVFRICASGVVKAKDGEYRVSPITGEEVKDFMKQRALILTRKYRFTVNNREKMRDKSVKFSYSDEWLKELQD